MIETVVSFGPEATLSGILTSPEAASGTSPALIVLNSGLIHRVGACRISVKLARRSAEAGVPALRFDFSGTGDSGPRVSGVELEEGHVQEARLAMDFLETRHGITRFVLFGLCSGARDAFYTALEDERVVGIVQIDSFAYRTRRYYWNHYSGRIFSPRAWKRFLGNRLRFPRARDLLNSSAESARSMVVEMWPDYPPRREVEAGYGSLMARGVKIYAIYTGSWDDQYNYRDQFLHMYPGVDFVERLALNFMPDAAHVLPDPVVQNKVMGGVIDWMTTQLGNS